MQPNFQFQENQTFW